MKLTLGLGLLSIISLRASIPSFEDEQVDACEADSIMASSGNGLIQHKWSTDRYDMQKEGAYIASAQPPLASGLTEQGPNANMTVWDLYPSMDVHGNPSLVESERLQKPSNVDRQCGILWFYHIPKCGGTAFGEWLQSMQHTGYIDAVLPLMSMDHLVDFDKFHAENIEPILSSPRGRLVAIHHHHRGPGLYGFDSHFDAMQTRLEGAGCKLFRVTFLRQPVDRLVSSLYYRHENHGSSTQPSGQAFSEALSHTHDQEYYNGEISYILNNKMYEYGVAPFKLDSRFLRVEMWSKALAETNRILRTFDYVGMTEHLSVGVAKVAGLIGTPHVLKANPLRMVNTNFHERLRKSTTISDLVEKACTYDQKLYDSWKGSGKEEVDASLEQVMGDT